MIGSRDISFSKYPILGHKVNVHLDPTPRGQNEAQKNLIYTSLSDRI
jgi:hypothetical protein